ncbi:hypothetical protein [Nitratireductor basaltis]|uniref:Uncharacterized protein n=1 Tax=Nitratireductor basaltis TaxID=472175 RepID=A0A084UEH9_9HYPH|nr:hypothetical protein [Nitratireductor basaltis]KFB11365.1 hypothetical protein EL18_02413 [Nitratireductor basaltis]
MAMALVKFISRFVQSLKASLLQRYHPERHYMRGPGPACARRRSGGRSAHA